MYQQNKYSPESIRKMQIEAANRVKNMQAKAKKTLEKSMATQSSNYNPSNSDKHINNSNDQIQNDFERNSTNETLSSNSLNNIINIFFKDQEKSLLIVLLLLLISDNADQSIIFALIYILM